MLMYIVYTILNYIIVPSAVDMRFVMVKLLKVAFLMFGNSLAYSYFYMVFKLLGWMVNTFCVLKTKKNKN